MTGRPSAAAPVANYRPSSSDSTRLCTRRVACVQRTGVSGKRAQRPPRMARTAGSLQLFNVQILRHGTSPAARTGHDVRHRGQPGGDDGRVRWHRSVARSPARCNRRSRMAAASHGRHGPCLFCSTARFFRPGYLHNLVQNWLLALDGVMAKLSGSAKVADVGCGHGWSTVFMAQASPQSQFVGFDFHAGSIEQARAHARKHNICLECPLRGRNGKRLPGAGASISWHSSTAYMIWAIRLAPLPM